MSISYSNAGNGENENVRHSARPNKGEWRTLVQLTSMSAAIENQPRTAKTSVKDIPLMQGVNPMAPKNTKAM